MNYFTHDSLSQIGKFGLVGVINTLIDFAIFNILTSKRFKISKIKANICSTTVAMVFSFFANRQAVFEAGTGHPVMQAVLFFIVTAIGLYVIQTGVLFILTERWRWPRKVVVFTLRVTGLKRLLSTSFVLNNGSKAVGVIFSLTWNFILYKYVVFR